MACAFAGGFAGCFACVFRLLSRRWARALGSAGWLLAGSLHSGDPPLLGGQGLWRSLPLTGPLRRPALAWGARSLAEFGPYLTAPATCPCWGARSLAEFGHY